VKADVMLERLQPKLNAARTRLASPTPFIASVMRQMMPV
jgi:hypothetical protein